MDGLRYDYVQRDLANLPAFKRLLEEGVTVKEGVIPIFPSESNPNFQSIATGLHAENHGIVDNNFYDSKQGLVFSRNWTSSPEFWSHAEPIWTHAVRAGRQVASYHWQGACVPVNGTRPQFCKEYDYKLFVCKSEPIQDYYR